MCHLEQRVQKVMNKYIFPNNYLCGPKQTNTAPHFASLQPRYVYHPMPSPSLGLETRSHCCYQEHTYTVGFMILQWNLSIEGTIGTQLAVLYTVEPLYRGHHWDPAGCPVYSGTSL